MFRTNRVYSTINTETGIMKWYFKAREGSIGPFNSKPHALLHLSEFVENSMLKGDNGGRPKDHEISIAAQHVQGFVKYSAKY